MVFARSAVFTAYHPYLGLCLRIPRRPGVLGSAARAGMTVARASCTSSRVRPFEQLCSPLAQIAGRASAPDRLETLKLGTRDEVIAYLMSPEVADEVATSVKSLADAHFHTEGLPEH
jgi:hypothetical protein